MVNVPISDKAKVSLQFMTSYAYHSKKNLARDVLLTSQSLFTCIMYTILSEALVYFLNSDPAPLIPFHNETIM